MVTEPQPEATPTPQESVAPESSKRQKKTKEGGGGSFKEHPYTFLAPDDPILVNCM